jgi:hypothetical protein
VIRELPWPDVPRSPLMSGSAKVPPAGTSLSMNHRLLGPLNGRHVSARLGTHVGQRLIILGRYNGAP